MRLTFDVWYQELRSRRECRRDAVNRAIPVGRILLRAVTTGNDVATQFQVKAQARIMAEIDKTSTLGKRIDDALPPPLHFAGGNVPGGHQRQFAIRLDIERLEVSDVCLVRAGRYADPHLAAHFLKAGKTPLQAANQGHLIQ